MRHPVKSSFLDHSLLWVLTTDRRPTGLGCGGGFICDSLSIQESSEHPMGTRHGINSLLPRVGVACPQVHFLEAPEPLLCPNASVERAQPALGLLLGADVLNMVPGWGTLSCRDPHGHLKHLLEKLQKTEAHVRTDNTAGQDGATRASVWWARGQYEHGPGHQTLSHRRRGPLLSSQFTRGKTESREGQTTCLVFHS